MTGTTPACHRLTKEDIVLLQPFSPRTADPDSFIFVSTQSLMCAFALSAYHSRTMQTGAQTGRQMGVWAATAVVTGEAISLGIFLTPAGMARSLGSPVLLAAVWCGMALVTLAGALCFTELAVRNPHDGGEYLYLRRGFGRRVAFLYGWMAAVVMYPGVAAALCVGTVPYIQALVPLPQALASALPALMLLTLGALNYFGTRLSSGVMTALNWLKVPVLAALVGWALVSGNATMANLAPLTARRPGSDPLLEAIAGAAISAFFCFGGWWEAGKIAGEVRNPSRNLPIAFSGGVLIVTAIYLLVSFAFVAVVPMQQIQSNTAFVAQFGQALFGAAGGRVLSLCVVLCVLGGLMVLSMAVPRVTYALARGEIGVSGARRPARGICSPASALRHSGQCRSAADRNGAARPEPRRLRPDPCVHHLFRGRLSRIHRRNSVPRDHAGAPLVVSAGANRLHRRQRSARHHAADAQPRRGTAGCSHCSLRPPRPVATDEGKCEVHLRRRRR